jgi:broad specificity phosphatase PhoE
VNIILSRHGNTFGPNDPVVWTGATNDLPLVEKGFAQAEHFAQALVARGVVPSAVYCSPLQRTSKYACVIIQRLKLLFQPTIDPRINEVDYGEWTGLTNEQVKTRFGEAALKGWDERSQWPAQGNWGGAPSTLISEVKSFVEDLKQRHGREDTVVVVTSNGKLRYFLTLAQGEFEKRVEDGSFKVKTGNICKLVLENGKVQIDYWNAHPDSSRIL